MAKIKVVIVDDSQLICDILTSIFTGDHRFDVVGVANDPFEARELIKDKDPDVITLDVEMPRMNGIAFLKNLMRLRPMPVVMISTLTSQGSAVTMQALELGAIDFIEKPSDINQMMSQYRQIVLDKVSMAAGVSRDKLKAQQRKLQTSHDSKQASFAKAELVSPTGAHQTPKNPEKLLAIGGSTGGLEALRQLLLNVKYTGAEVIVVCLHLPGAFTQSFAERLDKMLPIAVKEAADGERVLPGHVYIAPGGSHLRVKKRSIGYQCAVTQDEPVNLHRPSVDVLFDSVASQTGHHSMGIILTGMGKDGALGLLNMANQGAKTYAQDEESSVVWGMPGEASSIKAVPSEHVMALEEIAAQVTNYFSH